MPQYQDGKIYTITNSKNKIVYVGSTAQKLLCQRMCGHRKMIKLVERRQSPLYRAMRELGWEHFTIHLHHQFPCNSKDELEAEEMKTLDLIIAAKTEVYNSTIGGKQAAEVNQRRSAATIGDKNHNFGSGTIGYTTPKDNYGIWRFQYRVGGKTLSKSFAIQKYGFFKAKKMAQDLRKQIYPDWTPDPEEEFTDGLMALELD